jgi:hypothetical protein
MVVSEGINAAQEPGDLHYTVSALNVMTLQPAVPNSPCAT